MATIRSFSFFNFVLFGFVLISVIACKTDNPIINTSISAGIVIDKDSNVYQTVIIGTQTWMAENLKTTHYRNGDAIVNVTIDANWIGLSSGAWCDFSNLATNGAKYGHLYNWYAASDIRNIAPIGWHVPSDAEWTTLTNYLGGDNLAGSKLKEVGTVNWLSPNTGATNETGFSALPGGYRFFSNGTFVYQNTIGAWWSSTMTSAKFAWGRQMSNSSSSVNRVSSMANGFSIRCIKD